MTISAYITELLKLYGNIEIDINHVADGSDKYGLFKSPTRNIGEFNNGSYEITEHYQFLARQSTLSESERKEADEWLEDLTYWADDFCYNYKLPKMDKGRKATAFSITGNPCPMEIEDRGTMYQISLSITYIREREEMW